MAEPASVISRGFATGARANPRVASLLLFLRFGVVGVLNTVFGYVVFAALVLAGLWPSVALIVAAAAGVAFNFQTSRRLVFRSPGRALRFVAVYVVILTLNWAALRAANAAGMGDLPAQAVLALPISILSFIGQRTFVFFGAP